MQDGPAELQEGQHDDGEERHQRQDDDGPAIDRSQRLQPESRREFFAYAARVMRELIVDTLRRPQDGEPLTLDTRVEDQMQGGSDEVLKVHEALATLQAAEPRLAQVVEMRYFGGYTEIEIGEALGLTERTVRRDWEKARLLLLALLR